MPSLAATSASVARCYFRRRSSPAVSPERLGILLAPRAIGSSPHSSHAEGRDIHADRRKHCPGRARCQAANTRECYALAERIIASVAGSELTNAPSDGLDARPAKNNKTKHMAQEGRATLRALRTDNFEEPPGRKSEAAPGRSRYALNVAVCDIPRQTRMGVFRIDLRFRHIVEPVDRACVS